MIRRLARDVVELARASAQAEPSLRNIVDALMLDGFAVLAITRLRLLARRLHIPAANRIMRLGQMAIYGIEIGNDVELGSGVYFVHPIGTVLGGTSEVGERVRFLGNNTVGTARENGYPVIEDDVVVGCGARILGPIRVGRRAVIGANAVVVRDVPPGGLVVGVPGVLRRVSGAAYGDQIGART